MPHPPGCGGFHHTRGSRFGSWLSPPTAHAVPAPRAGALTARETKLTGHQRDPPALGCLSQPRWGRCPGPTPPPSVSCPPARPERPRAPGWKLNTSRSPGPGPPRSPTPAAAARLRIPSAPRAASAAAPAPHAGGPRAPRQGAPGRGWNRRLLRYRCGSGWRRRSLLSAGRVKRLRWRWAKGRWPRACVSSAEPRRLSLLFPEAAGAPHGAFNPSASARRCFPAPAGLSCSVRGKFHTCCSRQVHGSKSLRPCLD